MANEILGQRFSLTYISHPELLPDSPRMRRRLAHLLFDWGDGSWLHGKMCSELGVSLSHVGCGTRTYWPKAMVERLELRDVLDAITLVFGKVYRDDDKQEFRREVARIFREEHVSYVVDDVGGVHLAVDAAFQQARASAVSGLGASRYDGVRTSLDAAQAALDMLPQDGKAALRNIFFANEALFRLIFPAAHQLGTGEIQKHLKPAVDAKFCEDATAQRASHKLVAQYVSWVEAAHFYRHEPGTEEPAQPPIDLSISMVSSGMGWLRWLRHFDKAK